MIRSITSRPDVSYSYWYLFNSDPKFDEEYEPDNWRIAVNNENFRQSIMHGLDRVNALQAKDANDPESLLSDAHHSSGRRVRLSGLCLLRRLGQVYGRRDL